MTTDRKVVNYKPLTLVRGSWEKMLLIVKFLDELGNKSGQSFKLVAKTNEGKLAGLTS